MVNDLEIGKRYMVIKLTSGEEDTGYIEESLGKTCILIKNSDENHEHEGKYCYYVKFDDRIIEEYNKDEYWAFAEDELLLLKDQNIIPKVITC